MIEKESVGRCLKKVLQFYMAFFQYFGVKNTGNMYVKEYKLI